MNSHFNNSETNHSKTSNSDYVIGNSNLTRINMHNIGSLNKLINLQKETDKESSTTINDEITDDNNTSEEISRHKNPAEFIDHTCDDNDINLLNI